MLLSNATDLLCALNPVGGASEERMDESSEECVQVIHPFGVEFGPFPFSFPPGMVEMNLFEDAVEVRCAGFRLFRVTRPQLMSAFVVPGKVFDVIRMEREEGFFRNADVWVLRGSDTIARMQRLGLLPATEGSQGDVPEGR